MKTKKLTITKEDFGKTLREILIDLEINPEIILIKIENKFTPISQIIKKETKIEIIEVIKN